MLYGNARLATRRRKQIIPGRHYLLVCHQTYCCTGKLEARLGVVAKRRPNNTRTANGYQKRVVPLFGNTSSFGGEVERTVEGQESNVVATTRRSQADLDTEAT